MQNIPFEIVELQGDGFHILIDVELFDQPTKMVIDTGASKTVFDKKTLLNIGISEENFQHTDILSAGLGTDTMQSFILEIPHFRIGNWQIKNYLTAVLDLSSINYAYEKMNIAPVIGVLGGDILRLFNARIDYKKQTLTMRKHPLKFK